MKKISVITAAIFSLAYVSTAGAATSTDCSALGYNAGTADCTAGSRDSLKCPFNNSMVFCGKITTACDMRTAASCGTQGCKTYWSDCPSKCQTCNPADTCTPSYNKYNRNWSYVINRASGCGDYVGWSGGLFDIFTDDTCSTFRTRKIQEVANHNAQCPNKLLPTSGNYHPSSIRCDTCCIKKGTGSGIPTPSKCTDDQVL